MQGSVLLFVAYAGQATVRSVPILASQWYASLFISVTVSWGRSGQVTVYCACSGRSLCFVPVLASHCVLCLFWQVTVSWRVSGC